MGNQNLAVVGTGYWGKNLVRNFHDLGALCGVCDTSPENLSAIKKTYPDLPCYGSLNDLLAAKNVQSVAIATPAATHYSLAKKALESDLDVFVEKPISLSYKEGAELVDMAAAKNKILMVGHILEYHPAVIKLKELVNTGELGKINYIYSNRLNLGKFRTEENILWSFAPHDISIILSLLNEMPDSVAAHGGEFVNSGVVDVTTTHLSFPSGTKAHIFVSWLHPYKEQKLIVVGSRRMAVFNDTEPKDKLLLYDHVIEWIDRFPVPQKHDARPVAIETGEPLKSECMHFLRCVKNREKPLTDGPSGLNVLKVLEGSQISLKKKGNTVYFDQKQDAPDYFVHETAVVDGNVDIGDGTKIWHFAHVQSGARIGRKCVLGQNVNVANNVVIGDFVKIQNNVSVYEGVTLEDYVFCGPSMVFTNITDPRSKYPQVGTEFYKPTLVREGASLGANCTIVCGHTIGRFAFVGAGAVVTKDVPDFALVVGNPARIVGWMSEAGKRLKFNKNNIAVCEKSKRKYCFKDNMTKESE